MTKVLKIIKKVIKVIRPFGLKSLSFVLFINILQGIFQALSVFSILPFLSTIGNNDNAIFKYLPDAIVSIITPDPTFILGMLTLTIIILSNGINLYGDYLRSKYTFETANKIGVKIFSNYVYQDYTFHLKNNSAELVKRIQGDVNAFMTFILMAFIDIISRVNNTLLILLVLLIIAPIASITAGVVFLSAMFGFFLFFREKIKQGNVDRKWLMSKRYMIVKEALFGIKMVKIQRAQDFFIKNLNTYWKGFTRVDVYSNFAALVPRYTIETLSFSVLIIIIMYNRNNPDVLESIIPVMIMFVVAAYRILPNLQLVYAHLTKMQSNAYVLNIIHEDLTTIHRDEQQLKPAPKFENAIELNHIYYKYPAADNFALSDITIQINKGERIGFVGESGAGKSTFIELITGILNPTKGTYLIDGHNVGDLNTYDTRELFGYVPQDVFILDDSVAGNIAFGVSKEDLDMQRVMDAAKIAQIHEVIQELPEAYDTDCGESGVRFSGGQKQRIALARALYHAPQILILDESTSALDNQTEKNFMKAIYGLPKSITVIMIAHRLSTVEYCDKIYVLNKGEVLDSGNYTQLIENSSYFKSLANQVDL